MPLDFDMVIDIDPSQFEVNVLVPLIGEWRELWHVKRLE